MKNEEMNIEEKEKAIEDIIKAFNKYNLNKKDTVEVLSTVLYSIGIALEECDPPESSEKVLLMHAKKPTLGNALMAQALWMKETWQERKEK